MKPSPVSRLAVATTALAAVHLFAAPCRAELLMTLSGTPGSSILNVLFSGSAMATSSTPFDIDGIGWGFEPTSYDPFPAAITGGDVGLFDLISGSAEMTINGVSYSIGSVFLQDSVTGPATGLERFGASGAFDYRPTPGMEFSWSGSATIDLSPKGLTFDDLAQGSTTVLNSLGGMEGRMEIIPEPGSASVLVAALLAFPFLRRRRD